MILGLLLLVDGGCGRPTTCVSSHIFVESFVEDIVVYLGVSTIFVKFFG